MCVSGRSKTTGFPHVWPNYRGFKADHFLNTATQLDTTVSGGGDSSGAARATVASRKRFPFAVTSYWSRLLAGDWVKFASNIGCGTPASKDGLILGPEDA